MSCYYPMPAWKHRGHGSVVLREPLGSHETHDYLRLPCGSCIGCRIARAREWSCRCMLEAQAHDECAWTTLTYCEDSVPVTLDRTHLQKYLKRVRKRIYPRRFRFFASGEYGEKYGRPHFHVLFFGLGDDPAIEAAWPFGYVKTYSPVEPAMIAYTAGYCAKKIGWKEEKSLRISRETGEVYRFEPPYVVMSRGQGIAAGARRHWKSWRKVAVVNGSTLRVPRFLHEAWLDQATPEMVEKLMVEKRAESMFRDTTRERLDAAQAIALAKLQAQSSRRSL